MKVFYPCSILLTFLHFCVLTFLYLFTFEKILSLILGSISTILLSWLKARNKMFACWVSVTWLFWLKVSSRGCKPLLSWHCTWRNIALRSVYSKQPLYFEYYVDRNSSLVDTAVFIPLPHSAIERDIWCNKYCLSVINQSLTERFLIVSRECFFKPVEIQRSSCFVDGTLKIIERIRQHWWRLLLNGGFHCEKNKVSTVVLDWEYSVKQYKNRQCIKFFAAFMFFFNIVITYYNLIFISMLIMFVKVLYFYFRKTSLVCHINTLN